MTRLLLTYDLFSRRQLLAAAAASRLVAARTPLQAANITVYQEEGRYGGWPANHGIWTWGSEIVVGFTSAHFKHAETSHAIDFNAPQEQWQARSLDGGETWSIEKPSGIIPPELGGAKPAPMHDSMDFTHPKFAMTIRFAGIHAGPSRIYHSSDRCRTWKGPFTFTVDGIDKIAARTDYIVRGRRDCIMFGSAAKTDGHEGRVFCAETKDGGLTWKLLSLIGPEPSGYMIMPSTVRLSDSRLLTTIRHKDPDKPGSIDSYISDDAGRTWKFTGEAAPKIGGGNPPALVKMRDGRLSLTYGYRAKPFGIRARISEDQGRTWGEELVLRDDAPTGDLGYPRAVERPDGKILSVYYFNGPKDQDRAIQATIWKA